MDTKEEREKKIRERQVKNQALVHILMGLVESCPELRFSQILLNFGFVETEIHPDGNHWVDDFYKEPHAILDRVRAAADKLRPL